MFAASGVTVRAEIARVNYTRIVEWWNSRSLSGWDEPGSSFGSRATAVGARGAEFERRAGTCAGYWRARRPEFAQRAHRSRTVASGRRGFKVSEFQGLVAVQISQPFVASLRHCNFETLKPCLGQLHPWSSVMLVRTPVLAVMIRL